MAPRTLVKNVQVVMLVVIILATILKIAKAEECYKYINTDNLSHIDFKKSRDNQSSYPFYCTWKFENPPNCTFNLAFYSFYLDYSANCNQNYIALYEGNTTADPLIAKLCGHEEHPVIKSTAQRILLAFRAEESDRGNYVIAFIFTECHYSIKTYNFINTTEVTSPNYPNSYPNAHYCTWNFETTPNCTFKMRFYTFHLEPRGHYAKDYVKLYDGNTKDAPQLGQFWGNETPPDIKSTTNRMLMIFSSDGKNSYKGFRAIYSTECFHFVSPEEYIVTSPNYPDRYPHNYNSTWIFETTPGYAIKLVFDYFKLQSKNEYSFCANDVVELYDGDSTEAKLMGSFCGSEIPHAIRSTSHKMFMVFHSDGSVALEGFRATISQECYQYIKTDNLLNTISLRSPNYPSSYPDNYHCAWEFETTPNCTFRLSFLDFYLESSDNCRQDYVALYEGNTTADPLLGKFCGNETPLDIKSKAQRILMVFHSDGSISQKGFEAAFLTECHQYIKMDNLNMISVRSPNYPSSYPVNYYYSWAFENPPNCTFNLIFNDIVLQSSANCSQDYVALYDGNTTSNILLGKFCGRQKPPAIKSTSHRVLMVFRSDGSVSQKGFEVAFFTEWHYSIKAYNFINASEVTSPNYPNSYPNMYHCNWIFETTPNCTLKLRFHDFEVELGTNCSHDYVALYDGNTMADPLLGKFCGFRIPPAIISKSHTMLLVFHSDESVSFAGFRATYSSDFIS